MHDDPDLSQPEASPPGQEADLVPAWLALLVLVLLLAVAVLAGFVIRGLIVDDEPATVAEMALEDWQREVEADPSDPDALIGLGYSYQQQGENERAIEMYDRALELDAANPGALYNKGVALLALDRGKEAEVVLWDVLEVTPDHVLAAKALGEYYIGRGHYKSALTALEPVIEARPEFADLQYLAGYSCEQLDLVDHAIAYYRGALTYVPDHVEAREGLERLESDR
jgi:tetratricopeptide (TPR) repeat protein